MFRKAARIVAPFAVGTVAGLLAAMLVFGVQVAIKTIIPVIVGIAAAFAAALYIAKRESGGMKGKGNHAETDRCNGE